MPSRSKTEAIQTRICLRLAKTRDLLGLIFAGLMVGCAPLTVPKKSPGGAKQQQASGALTHNGILTDCVLNQQGMSGVSGFGARILFYGRTRKTPIMVDGSLTVYGY